MSLAPQGTLRPTGPSELRDSFRIVRFGGAGFNQIVRDNETSVRVREHFE
jgi:hypothetical protein